MKTPPEMGYAATISTCAVVVLAVVAGCGGYMRARPTPIAEPAKSFLESRSQPMAASAPVDPSTPPPTVEVTGAVERPGTLLLEPSLQTLREALAAAGGTTPTAGTLLIRPGDEVVSKLFAQDGGAESLIEIPLAAVGERPVYLRPGDVIAVTVVESPVAEPAVNAPAPVTVAVAAPSAPVAPAPAAAPSRPPAR